MPQQFHPEQDYFSEGMAEEILNSLSHLKDLKVASRTSSFQFKGKNVDLHEVGKKLRVGAVLEGSVRKHGNKLRITAQLINVEDGFHLRLGSPVFVFPVLYQLQPQFQQGAYLSCQHL